MRAIIPLLLVITTASASVTGGYLHDGVHISPATNVVASRTIVGGAIGGGPTRGAVSAAQYSQTVSVPANVQTVISTHTVPNYGYSGTSSSNHNQNTNAHNTVGYSTYGYENAGHGDHRASGHNPAYGQSTHISHY